jgi:hypothetical protein
VKELYGRQEGGMSVLEERRINPSPSAQMEKESKSFGCFDPNVGEGNLPFVFFLRQSRDHMSQNAVGVSDSRENE